MSQPPVPPLPTEEEPTEAVLPRLLADRHALATELLGSVVSGGPLDLARERGVNEETFGSNEAHRWLWRAASAVSDRTGRASSQGVLDWLVANEPGVHIVGGAPAFWEVAARGVRGESHFGRIVTAFLDVAYRVDVAAATAEAHALALEGADVGPLLDGLADRRPTSSLTLVEGEAIRSVPAPTFYVEGLLQDGFGIAYGPPESGKSLLAVDLAVCVASGTAFYGRAVRKTPVLYLAAEGAAGVSRRLAAASRSRNVPLDGVLLTGDPVSLLDENDVAAIGATVRQNGVGLLVLDTWARLTAGGNENDGGEMGRAIQRLDRIRDRYGCSVLVLHHTRKDDVVIRGSGALPGAADSTLLVTQERDDDENPTGNVDVRNTKQKDAQHADALRLRIVEYDDSVVLASRSASGRALTATDERRADALAFLRSEGTPIPTLAVVASFGDDVARSLLRHPEVEQVVDEAERPCLVVR